MARLLLVRELAEGVAPDGGVVAGHAQGAAALAGHAGEALPPGEVVDRHHVEAHPLPPRRRLLLPEDGGGWRVDTERGETGHSVSGWLEGRVGAALLTGEGGAGGPVEAVAAVAAGGLIIGVLDRGEGRAAVHLFVSSFQAEGRTFLHGNWASEGAEADHVKAELEWDNNDFNSSDKGLQSKVRSSG